MKARSPGTSQRIKDGLRRAWADPERRARMLAGRRSVYKNASMSFEEIGQALGISKNNAQEAARSALDKLRRHPKALEAFRELVRLRQQEQVRLLGQGGRIHRARLKEMAS
ncbi:MAG: hypothetical protein ACRD2R_06760 [Terriglobales bacterium]